MILKQLSLFIENKPGTIAAPCKILAEKGISISTLSLADTKFFGVLRLIVKDWEKAKKILEENSFAVKVTDVVAIQVDHKPGSLYKVLETLDKNNINVEYMYAYAAGIDGKAVLVFRFDNPEEAVKKLMQGGELTLLDDATLFAGA